MSEYYGPPETMAGGGAERYGREDFGTALFFFLKSIDILHTRYLCVQPASRTPGPADRDIINAFSNALEASLTAHSSAPVADIVREATHRLRTISTMCDRTGVPSTDYREGLDRISRLAPHVNVDEVLWS